MNEHKINVERAEAQKVCNILNDGLKTVSKITDGEVTKFDLKKVDKYLNNKTGFTNPEMSALAFNMDKEYKQVRAIITEGAFNSPVVMFKGGKYEVNEEPILEANTNYMRHKNVEHFMTFKNALELMESLPYDVRTLVEKCVKRDGSVNAEQFNLYCNLNSRIAR